MSNKKEKWYKLDNAAKIFPPTSDNKDPSVFRFACELDETVDKEKLQQSLNKTLENFPLFLSELKRGLFWYYLDVSDEKAFVLEENELICDKMNKDLLFRVCFYKKRINLEVYHALTDGTGAIEFFKNLVCEYLVLKHNIDVTLLLDKTSVADKELDSFKKYYKRPKKSNKTHLKNAYRFKGDRFLEDRLKAVEGIISTKKLLEISRSYNTTMTIYLCSLLIQSIGKTMSERNKKRPIVITIPVNLRKYYESQTIRNFFSTMTVSLYYNNQSIQQVIEEVSLQFKTNLTKEKIDEKMNSYSLFENIFIIRLIPIFIKDLVLRMIYKLTRKKQTMALSNVGVITIPSELNRYIKLFSVLSSTDGTQLCMCSYLDNTVISFTTHFIDVEAIKIFFRELSNKGLDVDINTNIIMEDGINEEML